jgi:hypothetical protein
MKSFLSLLIGIAIGFGLAMVVFSPGRGAAKMHRSYFPTGELHIECPVDDEERFHGEMKTYRRDGRLESSIEMYHGAMDRVNYSDVSTEDAE